MAATHGARPVFRLNPRHQELVRAKIQTGMIVEKLQQHIAGELDLSPTQLGACKLLLDKALCNAPTIAPDPDDGSGAPVSRYSLSMDQLRAIAAGEYPALPAPAIEPEPDSSAAGRDAAEPIVQSARPGV